MDGPRVLFVSSNRIGDAVITCGVLDHVIRTHPGARITVACGPAAAGVFQRTPGLERVILVEKHKSDVHWLKLWWQVVRQRWDLVLDLKGSALGYLVWTRRRAAYRPGPGRKFEQYAAVLGVRPAPLPVVWTAAADEARAGTVLAHATLCVGFGPTANWDGKLWPADRFAALAARLRATLPPGAAIAILGGPGPRERAMAAPVLAAIPDAIDLCGALTLAETAAVIRRCVLYVGNDSGLMHLAAATGTPTIGLCGSTIDRAEEMAPAGLRARWAMASGPAMDRLDVDTVLEACTELLAYCPPSSTSLSPSIR